MSKTHDETPREPAPIGAALENPAAQPVAQPAADRADQAPVDTLSPAVRRLVRQFDLDITGVHGSGPEGRIRVGDVMGLLGGRTDSGARDAPRVAPTTDDTVIEPLDEDLAASDNSAAAPSKAPPQLVAAPPTTTVFDCDLSRVLSHRKRWRQNGVEILLTSYTLAALADALEQAPEVAAASGVRFGVWLTTSEGEQRSALVDAASIPSGSLDDRLRAFDAALRQSLDSDTAGADLLVHHYGESGSLLATPTPIGAGHAASVGIGRVRREIVVRTTDGVEAPRVAARCYLSLSFYTDRVAFHRANQFMAHATRVLEQWPE
jgi:2-oxoglutarate dehydrogenase E2 component (dihydrolipoamide succinyltransferase)